MQPSLKKMVLKPSKPSCLCSEAEARRENGRSKQNPSLPVYICRGLESTLGWNRRHCLLGWSWNPYSSVAGLINSCTQSLIQALLRGGGSLAMSVVSVLVYRSCICCVVEHGIFAGLELRCWKTSTTVFFFLFEDASFLTCIFLSAFWLPASLKVRVSVRSMATISSWVSLYRDASNCKSGRLMLIESLSPAPSFCFSHLPLSFRYIVVFAFKGCI